MGLLSQKVYIGSIVLIEGRYVNGFLLVAVVPSHKTFVSDVPGVAILVEWRCYHIQEIIIVPVRTY